MANDAIDFLLSLAIYIRMVQHGQNERSYYSIGLAVPKSSNLEQDVEGIKRTVSTAADHIDISSLAYQCTGMKQACQNKGQLQHP